MIRAYAAHEAGGELKPFEYDPGELKPEQVEIDVLACGICHSDLSMLNNEWHITAYPLVPGHEVIGRIARTGGNVKHLKVGDTVGLGWFSGSCMTCDQCMSGNHNLCGSNEQTIVGRFGGFADKVRCNAEWAIPVAARARRKARPARCSAAASRCSIRSSQFDVRPTDRVGVIGIGGLGHLAVQFLNKWGCEVTAFTTSDAKRDEALAMGAHHVVNSRDEAQLEAIAGSLNFILSTVNADLNWPLFLGALAPKGRLHTVGVVPSPIPVPAFALIARPEEHLGIASGFAGHHPQDARVLRPPPHRADHRALPDEPGQRGDGASRSRQGALSGRARK